MTGVIVIMAVALFLAGVAIGVFAAVAVAVRREDRSYPLTGEAPGRLDEVRALSQRPGPPGPGR